MAILAIDNLAIRYRTTRGVNRAVDGASFSVPEGAVVGLVGESGCGKTTVARAITGVLPRNATIAGGSIMFRGQELVGLGARAYTDLRWREIAFIPQSAMNSLDPVYRVGTQLGEVLTVRGGFDRARARARSIELFEMVGLNPQRLSDYPHQFSGGMRQRAAIALALALDPKLIIADEPVTALDVIVQRQVLDTIRNLSTHLGLSAIIVTHDISVVAYLCSVVAVMYAGRIVEFGPADRVMREPAHPYTMGLMNASPDLERAGEDLVPIEGSPPSLSEPPPGCRFAERCPFALPACSEAQPPMIDVAPGHRAACIRSGEVGALRTLAREASTWRR